MLFQPEEFVKEVDLKVSGRAQGPQLSTSSPPSCVTLTSSHMCVPCLALEFAPRIRALPPKDSSVFTQRRGHPRCGISRMLASPLSPEIARSLLTRINLRVQGRLLGTRWIQR